MKAGRHNAGSTEDIPPSVMLRWILVASVAAALGAMIVIGLAGCTGTVTPAAVTAGEIAYDGNVQNAGIVGLAPDGGIVITPAKRAYYNELIALYGQAHWPDRTPIFLPALHADEGMTERRDGNFEITRAMLARCTQMHQWLKMGRLPGPTVSPSS